LWVRALGADAIEDILRSHVEPANVDIGIQGLEATLEQRQEIAAVGRIDDKRSAGVPGTGGDNNE